ncbi:hypothetical protein B0H13DRAFT_1897575 [Mycena leptocephala]|nr:hypothetical protein B0H13DRAFT_1897575 [Mycena leptocephala]
MPRISARARAARKAFIRSRRTYLRSTAASLGLTPTQIAEDAHAWAAITAAQLPEVGARGALASPTRATPEVGVQAQAGGRRPLQRSDGATPQAGATRRGGTLWPRSVTSMNARMKADSLVPPVLMPLLARRLPRNHLGEDESAPIVDPAAELLESPPFWINTPSTDDPTPIHPPTPPPTLLRLAPNAVDHAVNVDINAAELSHSKPRGLAFAAPRMSLKTAWVTLNTHHRLQWSYHRSPGGMPRDVVGWERITGEAATLLDTRVKQGSLMTSRSTTGVPKNLTRQSQGISHGGGQTEPGELCNNPSNTALTDELLQQECFQRLAGFANCPDGHDRRVAASSTVELRTERVRACTFNFGPRDNSPPSRLRQFGVGLVRHHCAGNVRPGRRRPHFVGFEAGDSLPTWIYILIPSAIIRHSNVPVGLHERRFSFTQYTAGGLFRWIRNGFKTDEAFQSLRLPLKSDTSG